MVLLSDATNKEPTLKFKLTIFVLNSIKELLAQNASYCAS